MKVTIGICAYNVENYIEQCVRSALNQTYKNIEIVVIDDGSTDKTSEILNRLVKENQRMKVIHKKNAGHAAGREDILKLMRGEAVFWLDSDDYLNENAVERTVELMEQYDADIVKTPIKKSDADYAGVYNREEYLRILLPDKIHSNVIGSLIRKEVYNGVKHHIGYTFEDFYIYPRLVDNAKKIVVDNEFSYCYRAVRPGSVTFEGRSQFRGFYPRAVHHGDRYIRYKDEFPEESNVVLKRFTDYACMACLYAGKDNYEKMIEVRNLLMSLHSDIESSDDITAYKKWLVKAILNSDPLLPAAKLLHTLKGNVRTQISRRKGEG